MRYLKDLWAKSMMPAIVSVSCIGAISPMAGTSIYVAGKAAMSSYMECLIAELGRQIFRGTLQPGSKDE